MDLTRTIHRKKEKELAALQFVGGEASPAKQPVLAKKTVGRNDPCPCGSGKSTKNAAVPSLCLCSLARRRHAARSSRTPSTNYQKRPAKTILTPDTSLLNEFGVDATEQAEYSAGKSISPPRPGDSTIRPAPWPCSSPSARQARNRQRDPSCP